MKKQRKIDLRPIIVPNFWSWLKAAMHLGQRSFPRFQSALKLFFLQADIDLSKRAGELSEEEVDKIVTIMQNPRQYKIPDWFLNRQKDIKDGK